MFAFLKRLRDRWTNWCGDRDLEMAIRRQLTADGYYGGSAKLTNVRLAAVQRPGWLQVYRFDVSVKQAMPTNSHDDEQDIDRPAIAEFQQLYGLVREDARRDHITVRTFHSTDERREMFESWSEDLVQLRGGQAML